MGPSYGGTASNRYDYDHMTRSTDNVEWACLVETQPVAALIPQSLRMQARQIEASSRETLFRTGDSVRDVYLVISGEARLVRWDRHGSEIILQRSRGGFIAEASLDSRTYHCGGIVSESTIILAFAASAFREALEDDSVFRRAWQSQLAKEVRKLRAQCERLSLHNAADRITHYIEAEGTDGALTLTHSRKSWAAELGLSHEALYRTLRRMQDEGLLYVDGSRIATKP